MTEGRLSDDDRHAIHALLGAAANAVDVAIQLCDEDRLAAILGLLFSKTKLKYRHLAAEHRESRAKRIALMLLEVLHEADC